MPSSNSLPKAPPPQNTPFGVTLPDGRVIVDLNWWLLITNLCNNVFGVSGQSTPAPTPAPAVPDSGQYSDILPDPKPQAQPIVSITVGASPFSYTAAFDGMLAITGGTGVSYSLTRSSGGSVSGLTGQVMPVSRRDVVQVTYTTAPTMQFLPS